MPWELTVYGEVGKDGKGIVGSPWLCSMATRLQRLWDVSSRETHGKAIVGSPAGPCIWGNAWSGLLERTVWVPPCGSNSENVRECSIGGHGWWVHDRSGQWTLRCPTCANLDFHDLCWWYVAQVSIGITLVHCGSCCFEVASGKDAYQACGDCCKSSESQIPRVSWDMYWVPRCFNGLGGIRQACRQVEQKSACGLKVSCWSLPLRARHSVTWKWVQFQDQTQNRRCKGSGHTATTVDALVLTLLVMWPHVQKMPGVS